MSDVTVNGVTYRQQYRKCGKAECRCAEGDEADQHGPYWYSSGDYGGLKYVGKNLPEWITNHLELLKTEKGNLEKLKREIAERIDHHRRELQRAEGEQAAISALQKGQWVDQRILKLLQLEKFSVNGHK